MKLRALFGGLALSLFLAFGASPVVAQELYVSNRPFKGEVTKAGSGLMVEVEPLAKALKLEVVVSDGQVKIKDRSVPVTVSASGKNLVILDQFAAAAGLTVRKNPDFGHTDVYANTTAPSGAFLSCALDARLARLASLIAAFFAAAFALARSFSITCSGAWTTT